eukprot:1194788-Prorocentrum_minimum.AAC.2
MEAGRNPRYHVETLNPLGCEGKLSVYVWDNLCCHEGHDDPTMYSPAAWNLIEHDENSLRQILRVCPMPFSEFRAL